MARGMHRLSPREVNTLPDGRHADGNGLYLQVTGGGSGRSWIFRYHVEGRGDRNMGLGPTHTVGIAEAREKARLARLARLEGDDPLELREKARLARKLEAAKEVTFEACVDGWMATKTWTPHWAGVTRSRLRRFAYPRLELGKIPIQKLRMPEGVSLVHKVLEALWLTKTNTAKALQENIEGVLNWAIAKQYISGDNAASLKGPLGTLLAPLKEILVHEHHEALPYKEVGAFMAHLRAFEDIRKVRKDFKQGEVGAATLAARRWRERNHPARTHLTSVAEKAALEFLVLTAVRKGQVLKMRWEDVDRDERIWVCEHHKTKKKTGEDYVIPLSDQAMAVLDAMRGLQKASGIESQYVFLGRFKKPISHNTLNDLLARMPGCEKITLHGFRTSFGDWSVEHGHDERDSEMALGHVVGNGVRNIYKRNAKRIEPRRLMMQAWADYCHRTEPLPAEVIPIRRAKSEENAA
jgi:integrase